MEKKLDVKVRLLSEAARVPVKAHHGDAGWDFFASEEIDVGPGETRIIKTGVALEIPSGWYGQLKSRSGLGAKGLIVTAGVVDSGYRGEVGVVVVNGNKGAEGFFSFRPGDKIAQMVFLPVPEVEMTLTEELNGSARGHGGFGSTGG
ncbi:MAG: dUTP diphosphatase [Deltaproteobacteria bacterium]|nr:dUTP diphosphatase [Deltaproteobacteria bacterium]